VKSAVNSGNLTAGRTPSEADVFIIAVPTPFKYGTESDKTPDLSFVQNATEQILPFIRPGNLVILESTSPVGTTDEVVADTLSKSGIEIGKDLFIAHCPERVLPGRILIELVENDRVVGGVNQLSTDKAISFYSEFVSGSVLPTTAKTAEMVKLTENSSRDVQIAFANELSMICESEGINTWEVIELANRHPRVEILKPGPGVGGHCIAVDPWFIIDRSPIHSKLISTARHVNERKPMWVLEQILKHAQKLKTPTVACLGITYKANIDDIRESPALQIVNQLINQLSGEVLVADPNVKSSTNFPLVDYKLAIDRADIVVILVDHEEFIALPASTMNEKIIIDTRGIIK
jgi:UDP-N-acetyl-D-mannosaminuronic acid dehydrogenase